MPTTDSTAVSSPSRPSSSRSCSESTSLVSREMTLPEVYFSWNDERQPLRVREDPLPQVEQHVLAEPARTP